MSTKTANPLFQKILVALVVLLMLFSVTEKAILYSSFSVQYTDEDQCIMWLSADELLKGHLHEPCFFGQAYNSCLEGWIAAPLAACGLELYQAVPLATILMSALPFMLIALHGLRRQEYLTSIIALACLLGFSLDYKLVSILPRGFISGVFCFGIGYWLLLRERKHHFFWFALFAFFGVAFNEMSFFLLFPVLLSLWLNNLKNKAFYRQSFLALAFGGSYKIYAYLYYYVIHPDHNYFVKAPLGWSVGNLMKAADCLDTWLFGDFTLICICFLTALAGLLIRKKFQSAVIVVSTMLLVFLSFGLSRMQEGSSSIFFSYSRVYVFMPLLIAVFFSFFKPLSGIPLNVQLPAGLALSLLVSWYAYGQEAGLDQKIAKELAVKEKPVKVLPVKEVLRRSYEYIGICKATGNTVFAIDCPLPEQMILYVTIPLLSHNSIHTFMPEYDRRSWLYLDMLTQQPEKILVFGNIMDRFDRPGLQQYKRRVIRKDPDWLVEYRLTKNMKRTFEEDFKIHLRRH